MKFRDIALTAALMGTSGAAAQESPQTSPPTATAPANADVLEKKAQEIYGQVKKLLTDELAEAKKQGKRLSVLIGEDHTDHGSLLTQILFLKAASDLGITDGLLVEHDEAEIQKIRERNKDGNVYLVNVYEAIEYADHKKIPIMVGDRPEVFEISQDRKMAETLMSGTGNRLMIVGSNHLLWFNVAKEDFIKADHRLLMVNISNVSAQNREENVKVRGLDWQASRDESIRVAPAIHQIEAGDEFEKLPKKMVLEIAAKVTGDAHLVAMAQRKPEPPVEAPATPQKLGDRFVALMDKMARLHEESKVLETVYKHLHNSSTPSTSLREAITTTAKQIKQPSESVKNIMRKMQALGEEYKTFGDSRESLTPQQREAMRDLDERYGAIRKAIVDTGYFQMENFRVAANLDAAKTLFTQKDIKPDAKAVARLDGILDVYRVLFPNPSGEALEIGQELLSVQREMKRQIGDSRQQEGKPAIGR